MGGGGGGKLGRGRSSYSSVGYRDSAVVSAPLVRFRLGAICGFFNLLFLALSEVACVAPSRARFSPFPPLRIGRLPRRLCPRVFFQFSSLHEKPSSANSNLR